MSVWSIFEKMPVLRASGIAFTESSHIYLATLGDLCYLGASQCRQILLWTGLVYTLQEIELCLMAVKAQRVTTHSHCISCFFDTRFLYTAVMP